MLNDKINWLFLILQHEMIQKRNLIVARHLDCKTIEQVVFEQQPLVCVQVIRDGNAITVDKAVQECTNRVQRCHVLDHCSSA